MDHELICLAIAVYIVVCYAAMTVVEKFSPRAQVTRGDRYLRKTMDAWLRNGYLVESATTLEALQADFSRVISMKYMLEDGCVVGHESSNLMTTTRSAYHFCAISKEFHDRVKILLTDTKAKRVQDMLNTVV